MQKNNPSTGDNFTESNCVNVVGIFPARLKEINKIGENILWNGFKHGIWNKATALGNKTVTSGS